MPRRICVVSHLLFYISFVLKYSLHPKISNVFDRSSYSKILCKYYLFCYDLIIIRYTLIMIYLFYNLHKKFK